MNGDFLKQRDEEYDLFKSKGDNSSFLKYEEDEESSIEDTETKSDTTMEEGE